MSCVCVVTDGAREFPDNLAYVLTDGFGSTAPRKEKYLGNKTGLVGKSIVSLTVLVKNEVDAAVLLEWWVDELNYGTEPFTIDIPFFGIRKAWTATAIGELPESLKIGVTREVKMKLKIHDDLSVAIQNNLCEEC